MPFHSLSISPQRRWLKFCGFRNREQAEEAIRLRADALGFNFWLGSKRYLAMETAKAWLPDLQGRVLRVGVFVNASLDEVHHAFSENLIDAAQFHGDEDADYCRHFEQSGLGFIKAIRVRDEVQLADLDQWHTPHLLLDAWQPDSYGGSGHTFNWNLAKQAAEQYPWKNFILSGGLSVENVAEALEKSGMTGADVASGIESAPGVKDGGKMRAFANAVHTV